MFALMGSAAVRYRHTRKQQPEHGSCNTGRAWRESGIDLEGTLRSPGGIGLPTARWEPSDKRLFAGSFVELLDCETVCAEIPHELRERLGEELVRPTRALYL